MPRFAWLGRLRGPIRYRVFDLIRRLFETDDGRRIAWDTTTAHLGQRRLVHINHDAVSESPYAELPQTALTERARPAPVFITARFRTGSTFVWNLFRHVNGCTAFYEPLNERRWFDPSTRGHHTDSTHREIREYWHEYEGLEQLGQYFKGDWNTRNLYMDASFDEPELRAYIEALVAHAPERAVLQFNRIDFRLPWLRAEFPEARILHLYRNPRDQWCSSLMKPAEVPREISVDDFAKYDGYYLLGWAQDLSYQFPFLAPKRASHPYDLFYMIWRLSYVFGRTYADASFAYERLVDEPATEIARMLTAAGIERVDPDLLRRVPVVKSASHWRAYAPADWYAEREDACEAILRREFRILGVRPGAGYAPATSAFLARAI